MADLRQICEAHNLAIRGTKAEVRQRILDAGLELKLVEDLPFDEPETITGAPFDEDLKYYPERALSEPIEVDNELLKEFNPESD